MLLLTFARFRLYNFMIQAFLYCRLKWVFTFWGVLCTFFALAQVESDEKPLDVSQDGIGFHKDSVFLMNLRFRMQSRFGYFSRLDNVDEPGFEAVVRRLRLRFDGYVLHPKIGYYIQLSFSRADQDLVSGTVAQVIRDAMVYYTFSNKFYIGFGQSKLPGNRERVISSGNLQLPDRSIANGAFTLDRDFGFFAYSTLPLGSQQILQLKGTITTGEGRGQLTTNTGLAYTGRVEWLPLGRFANLGDFSEGDLEYETKPKLSLAAGYSFNHQTTKSGGQLGSIMPTNANMGTFIADMMFKYKGWGLMSEYFYRELTGIDSDFENNLAMLRVPRGEGFNIQLSKTIGKKHEIVARYAGVTPPAAYRVYQPVLRTQGMGYNFYLNKHRVKCQLFLGLDDRLHPEMVPELPFVFKNRLVSMMQVELGI